MVVMKRNCLVSCFIFLIINSGVGGNEKNSDNYITSSKSECFLSKNLFSCVKYKTAKFIWSVATGKIDLLKNAIQNEYLNLIAMPNDGTATEISEYRFESGTGEYSRALSFLKRSLHMFLTQYGFQISLETDNGARILNDSDDLSEHRGKKKRKLKLLLPLILLFKMMKIKILLINVLLGVGVIQILLLGGAAFLFNYFRNNTLCKLQGVAVHSHSHVVEPEPELYPSYSGYSHYSHPSYHSSAYNKDWASNRAYSAYNNYMDTTNPTLS